MLEIIQKLGIFQRKYFKTEIDFETKSGSMDIVSFVDKECEQMFRNGVSDNFQEDSILGEESYDKNHDYKQYKKLWIIDPLDGTLMFQRWIPYYAPMIAYVEDGIVQFSAIFFPEQDTLYYANSDGAFCNKKPVYVSKTQELQKSIINVSFKTLLKEFEYKKLEEINRQIGRIIDMSPTAQKFCMCINGQCDWWISLDGWIWDTVPGWFLLQQAGWKVTNFWSDSWDIFNPKVIVSNGHIHTDFQKLLES